MKLIPLDAVLAEIDKIMAEEMGFYETACREGDEEISSSPMVYARLQMLRASIDSLEAKEVDLEIEQRIKECPFREVICNRYEDNPTECDGRCSWVVDYSTLKRFKTQKGEREAYKEAICDAIDKIFSLETKEVDLEKEPIILTEQILKKNGFKLYAPPRYKEVFWSKIFEDKEKNGYVFDIYMVQRHEHLMTITPLASSDGKGHPDLHFPHPKTVQQLQKSLELLDIKDIIKV